MKKVLAVALILIALMALFAVTGVFVNASEAEKAPTVEELQDEIEKLKITIAELTVEIEEVKDARAEDIAAWMSRADQLNEEIASLKEALVNEMAERKDIVTLYVIVAVISVASILLYGLSVYEKKKKGEASSDNNG